MKLYIRESCGSVEPSLCEKPNNSCDTCGGFEPLEDNSG